MEASWTQIAEFMKCPIGWHKRYVEKIYVPMGKEMSEGGMMHKVLREYIRGRDDLSAYYRGLCSLEGHEERDGIEEVVRREFSRYRGWDSEVWLSREVEGIVLRGVVDILGDWIVEFKTGGKRGFEGMWRGQAWAYSVLTGKKEVEVVKMVLGKRLDVERYWIGVSEKEEGEFRRLVETFRRIVDEGLLYPNLSSCGFCHFREICEVERKGGKYEATV